MIKKGCELNQHEKISRNLQMFKVYKFVLGAELSTHLLSRFIFDTNIQGNTICIYLLFILLSIHLTFRSEALFVTYLSFTHLLPQSVTIVILYFMFCF